MNKISHRFGFGKWARTPAVAVIIVFAKEDCDDDEVEVAGAAPPLELDPEVPVVTLVEVIVEVNKALL